MSRRLSLGISPCPNDTYIFEALVHGRMDAGGLAFETSLEDVETLNARAARGEYDVVKVSVAAAVRFLDEYALLPCGGALGRGCGPLLVGRPGMALADIAHATVAIPGKLTTAHLLLELTGLHHGPRPVLRYDEVIPAVTQGRACSQSRVQGAALSGQGLRRENSGEGSALPANDCSASQPIAAGLVIHEGRFTYEAHGLVKLLDLGEWWERETGLPIPLGAIAIRRSLGPDVARQIAEAIRASLAFARRDPQAAWPWIMENAQEMASEIVSAHIATFVTDFSMDLGQEGKAAVARLLDAAARVERLSLSDVEIFAG